MPFLKEIRLSNLLSYGPDTPPLELRPLNVFIGPNGSGKSNLIEAISLLRSAPDSMADEIRESGGIQDWIWKGSDSKVGELDVVVENPQLLRKPILHKVCFCEVAQRFEILGESIADSPQKGGQYYYRFQEGRAEVRPRKISETENLEGTAVEPPKKNGSTTRHKEIADKIARRLGDVLKDSALAYHRFMRPLSRVKALSRSEIASDRSILALRDDPDLYPEIGFLAEQYSRISIYREWSFGRHAPGRKSAKSDLRSDRMLPDCSNLGLVLGQIRRNATLRKTFLTNLQAILPDVTDFIIHNEGGTVLVFLTEGAFDIPATRLSDGTLRYLCLLAILCNPTPPPLICIEEPELGLHPDVMHAIGKLLKQASERTQLIVTTHSEELIDFLSESPEDVVVCEKHEGQTEMNRLDENQLKAWLEEYSLGDLWRRGEIGGNRW